jgi:hypothetical protein
MPTEGSSAFRSSGDLLALLRHWFVRAVDPLVAWHNDAYLASANATQLLLSPGAHVAAIDEHIDAGVPLTPALERAREHMKIEWSAYSSAVDAFVEAIKESVPQPDLDAKLQIVREKSLLPPTGKDALPAFVHWDLFRQQLTLMATEAASLLASLDELRAGNTADVGKPPASYEKYAEQLVLSSLSSALEDLARRVRTQRESIPRCGRSFERSICAPGTSLLAGRTAEQFAQRLAMMAGDEIRDKSAAVARDAASAIGEDLQEAIGQTNYKARQYPAAASSASRPPSGGGCASERRPSSALSVGGSSISSGGQAKQTKSFRVPPDPYAIQWVARRNRTVEMFHAMAQASVACIETIAEKTSEASQTAVIDAARRGGLRSVLEVARDKQIDGLKRVRRELLKLERSGADATRAAEVLGDEWVRHRRAEAHAASRDVMSRPSSAGGAFTGVAMEQSGLEIIRSPGRVSSTLSIPCSPPASPPAATRAADGRQTSPKRQALVLPVTVFALGSCPSSEAVRPESGSGTRQRSASRLESAGVSRKAQLKAAAEAEALIHSLPRSAFPTNNGDRTSAAQTAIAETVTRCACRLVSSIHEEQRLNALRFGMTWRRSRGAVAIDKAETPLLESIEYSRLERDVQAVSRGRIRRKEPRPLDSNKQTAAPLDSTDLLDKFLNPSWHQGARSISPSPDKSRSLTTASLRH